MGILKGMFKLVTKFKLRATLFHLAVAAVLAWLIEQALLIDYIFAWFYGLNIVSFISFGFDKLASKKGQGRTPELTYHILGLCGGFPGIFAGRRVFNHKTSKTAFIVPMWVLFILQVLVAGWYFGNLDQVYEKWNTPGPKFKQEAPAKQAPVQK